MASTRTAAPKAPLLDSTGKTSKQVSLDGAVFGADIKPHLVHEAVRAEQNVNRAGTRGAKSRGQVSGGRSKPWRQKGTGRARIGTTRAPHWTGGGAAFPPTMRSFAFKVNRKEKRAAMRAALSAHVSEGTLALFDAATFDSPSTRVAAHLVGTWAKELPLVVVLSDEEEVAQKSFRNLGHVVVTTPAELEVSAVVWARSLLLSEQALPVVEARAGKAREESA
jgi:large subunit ribosomal protein L4